MQLYLLNDGAMNMQAVLSVVAWVDGFVQIPDLSLVIDVI